MLPRKGDAFQRAPATPNWDKEVERTLEHDGLPPLRPQRIVRSVTFRNVCDVWQRDGSKVKNTLKGSSSFTGNNATVVVSDGRIQCMGDADSCLSTDTKHEEFIDLKCGSLSLGLTTFGSSLGLSEVGGEASTTDRGFPDPLRANVPEIFNDTGGIVHAFDGLQFEGRDAL